MRILIELPTWLGDTVMATPAIEYLINFYNDSENSDDTLVEIDKLKNTTLNDLYDCYKKHKIKFDAN
jgi:ADP-heptose:LPS heptosyltransferase